MATVKVKLKVHSSDVLPISLNIDEEKDIELTGDNAKVAQSGQLTVTTTAITINSEMDGGVDNRALVYIKNTGVVASSGVSADPNIIVDDETSPIMDIAPGEFVWFSYNGGANSTLTVETASGTGYCDFFIAELT